MIEVIAPMDGTDPQRCFQSSSARAMGSKGRLSGFGTAKTLPAGHIVVSPVSRIDIRPRQACSSRTPYFHRQEQQHTVAQDPDAAPRPC